MESQDTLLALNAGSSSLKLALFPALPSPPPAAVVRGEVRAIGSDQAELSLSAAGAAQPLAAADHSEAFAALVAALEQRGLLRGLRAVGHRIVYGGTRHQQAECITDEALAELQQLAAIDPDHMPSELGLVRAARARWPRLPQVACYDTAFHRGMPRVARMLALPRRYDAAGVRRYGFHGLSYTFLLAELERVAGRQAALGRVVLAHLGAGSSLAAVRAGQPVDTTMGFTPTSGVMMATRTGDLDPGVLIHLARTERMDAAALDNLVNRRCGLLGVSETTGSLRELLALEGTDLRAAEAVALYCHQVKKAIGALCAVLGGLDTLVFAGGIGEHAPLIRARIADGLQHLGVQLDAGRNAEDARVISNAAGPCVVRVIATDEELVIARQMLDLLPQGESP